jgi:hypothetical protein
LIAATANTSSASPPYPKTRSIPRERHPPEDECEPLGLVRRVLEATFHERRGSAVAGVALEPLELVGDRGGEPAQALGARATRGRPGRLAQLARVHAGERPRRVALARIVREDRTLRGERLDVLGLLRRRAARAAAGEAEKGRRENGSSGHRAPIPGAIAR